MATAYAPDHRARLLAELVARRAAGETFSAIAATPGWPSRPTLRKWLRQSPELKVRALRRPPVRWSMAVALEICDRFGIYSLREICGQEDMPDRKTLHQWRRRHPWFDARLEAIRQAARQPPTGRRSTYCELIADDIVQEVFAKGSIGGACKGPDFPPARTVRDWAAAHPDFARRLQMAYDMAYEHRMLPRIERAWRIISGEEAVHVPRRYRR